MFLILMVVLEVPTESVYIRKENRMRLRVAEEKTDLSLARLINLLIEDGHLDEVVVKHSKGTLGRPLKG